MTNDISEVEKVREQLGKERRRSRYLKWVVVVSLLLTAVSGGLGYLAVGAVLAAVSFVGGIGFVRSNSRVDPLQTELVEMCKSGAKGAISDGRTAIQDGAFDAAETAFMRSVEFCEVGSAAMDQSPGDWEERAKKRGVHGGLPLNYAVSSTYLDLLESYSDSKYDVDRIDAKFTDTEDSIDAKEYAVAIDHIADLTTCLDDDSPMVEGLRKSTELTAITGIGSIRAEAFSAAGYEDPVVLANVSVDALAEIQSIGQKTAESFQSVSRTLVADVSYLSGLVGDETVVAGYRNELEELATQLRDGFAIETIELLETGVSELPDPSVVEPDEIEDSYQQMDKLRSEAVESVEPLIRLHELVSNVGWVSLDIPVLDVPDHILPVTGGSPKHTLSIALSRPELLQTEFDVSRQRAERAKEWSITQLSTGQAPLDQFESVVSEFDGYISKYESIAQWSESCREAIEDAEEMTEQARDEFEDSPNVAANDLSKATFHIGRGKSILESASFPLEVERDLETRLEERSKAVTEIETSIEELYQSRFVKAKKRIRLAEEQKESGHLETAESMLGEVEENLSTVKTTVDQAAISSAEEDIERLRQEIKVSSISKKLDVVEEDVQCARDGLGEDLSTTDDKLTHARSILRKAEKEFDKNQLVRSEELELADRFEQLQALIDETENRALKQDAKQNLNKAQTLVGQAKERAEGGKFKSSEALLKDARSRLLLAKPLVDKSEITTVETEIERVEYQITAARISADLDDTLSAVQTARSQLEENGSLADERFSELRSTVATIQEDIENKLREGERKQQLTSRVETLNESINSIEHRASVQEAKQILKDARDLLEDAQESIEKAELNGVLAAIETAQHEVSTIAVDDLDDEVASFQKEITSIRRELAEQRVSHALGKVEHELNRAKGFLQHDVDDTRERLRAARTHNRAASFLADSEYITQPTSDTFVEQIDRYLSQIQTLDERCKEREITEAIEEASMEIDDVRDAFQSGDVQEARERVGKAENRIRTVPDGATETEVDQLQEELADLKTKTAQHTVGEFISNAEETVEQAETERAAGEESEAIEAYQQAIKTYKSVKLDARDMSLPEVFEIEQRTDQLNAEIENAREQWVERKSQQIDRELRAGERAVAQGLDAVNRDDFGTAETKYGIAEEGAAAAKSWLHETTDDPSTDELALPSTIVSEYQSATNSLTGHLGYLRTQIDEATETGEQGQATPLGEYYDGLYILYRALPDTTHSLWREAVTNALFGGDGLADGVTEYGAQQVERNSTPISTLREENGNGDQITEFVCIDTAQPRPEDQQHIETDTQLPVAPDSGTVLPLDVDSNAVLDAIELLAEFPATPEADDGDGDSSALLDTTYFEQRHVPDSKPAPESAESDPTGAEGSVSSELKELQKELEVQIGE